MIKRNYCAICNSNLINLYILKNMPIKLTCTETPYTKNEALCFSQCEQCNTVQLEQLVPLRVLYSESHNYISVGKVWNDYFSFFCELITPLIYNKNILEIGDPSGKIANKVDNFNKYYIIEPNKNEGVNFKQNIEFIECFFDSNFTTDKQIDMIIHSHLFEHIYEPNIFLKKCYETLEPNGQMFFGVPNMEYIGINELSPFLGVFFEHTIFLNKQNIVYLLENNGFEIIEIYDYLQHSTLYHVKKMNIKIITSIVKIDNFKKLFNTTLENYKKLVTNINLCIEKSNLPVYIFGASYNSQMILSLGINITKLAGILDNCKEKQEKYLYGYDLKIFDPQILKDTNSIVILKNGYYVQEIKYQINSINPNTIFVI